MFGHERLRSDGVLDLSILSHNTCLKSIKIYCGYSNHYHTFYSMSEEQLDASLNQMIPILTIIIILIRFVSLILLLSLVHHVLGIGSPSTLEFFQQTPLISKELLAYHCCRKCDSETRAKAINKKSS